MVAPRRDIGFVPVRGAGRLTPLGGQSVSSGNNILLTPPSGKAIRVHYASYNIKTDCEVGFRFGPAGNIWLQNDTVAKSVIAKDFGDFRWIEGEPDEALYLNVSITAVVNWTIIYKIDDPWGPPSP